MKLRGREVILPTTMVGSWPRPPWMQGKVFGGVCDEDYVDMTARRNYEDAVKLCIKEQDLAGLDIVTDGNQYFEGETGYDKDSLFHFAPMRLKGFQGWGPPIEFPGIEHYYLPTVVGKIEWVRPIFGPVLEAAKKATHKPIKINLNTGPALIAGFCKDEYYNDFGALVNDLAVAFNHELKWLSENGADIIQLTEVTYLWFSGLTGEKPTWALDAYDKMLEGVGAHTTWHNCYGNAIEFPPVLLPKGGASHLRELFEQGRPIHYDEIHIECCRGDYFELDDFEKWVSQEGKTFGIGVVQATRFQVETPEEVAAGIKKALERYPADKIVVSTDCGLYNLPRDIASKKLHSLVQGTRMVREELGVDPETGLG